MELTDVLLSLLVAMVTASWASINARLGRHEGRLISIEGELATKPSREEFEAFRAEMRADFDSFRGEMRADFDSFRSEIRTDMTAQRSDITQIALAVGANRPQASEG